MACGSSKSDVDKSAWKKALDDEQIRRAITRIAHEILERNRGPKKVAVVGIRTRGEFVAERIRNQINTLEGVEVPLGVVDITLYRDDLSHNAEQPLVRGTDLPFNVDAFNIVLVDDVLFTGRTIRAALDAIVDFGRPISVQLAVLVDRGHRELPIRADYIGKNIPSSRQEVVEVCLCEKDGEDAVYLREKVKKNKS
ncbi:MAG TPA: bifunctional pyr operon transcriptional regulator/uracil phosphoribosyltransferase PyrR [Oligoflexia bacterium]|nr:bifunctional pyr operon transcriptional regulator/uracil phosphoribosyltransferase PyrR [Oligoflexia bacterium]HMP47539.1 bifunctional pyr operon transcriptional regulator/uracil phosphoribosyltransferase PyrR [Oligoflexia bacterium]